jgi:two-component system phosphate regulon response regulator OmpR
MKPHKNAHHLLVVDDDTRIRSLLQKYLIEQGYFVSSSKNAVEAALLLKDISCDLIILDVMMPGETGVEFTKKLRQTNDNIPIIMLTAMGDIDNRINGLEVGADDYIAKPFEPKELLLRINNILKRSQAESEIFYFADFIYNIKAQILLKEEQIIFLTNSEHCLLRFLLDNASQIVSREMLAAELVINERSVDVQIIRLRNKIETNPSRPQFLQTVRNQGYVLRI